MQQVQQAAKRPAAKDRPGDCAAQVCTLSSLPQLPEFQLHWEPEAGAPAQPVLQPGEERHIAALLAQYQREEGSLQVAACHPCIEQCVDKHSPTMYSAGLDCMQSLKAQV